MGKPAYAEGKCLDIVFSHDAVNDSVPNVFRDFVTQHLIPWNWQHNFRKPVTKGVDNITCELLAPDLPLNDIRVQKREEKK